MKSSQPNSIQRQHLELTRSRGDRHCYELDGVGTIRREGGVFSTAMLAETLGQQWHFASHGLFRRTITATNATGTVVGRFVPRSVRRGGSIDWRTQHLTLQPASSLRERYALTDGTRELVLIEGRGWGRRPVAIDVDPSAGLDSGLILFAAFIVHRLAVAASSVAGSSGAAASAVCASC